MHHTGNSRLDAQAVWGIAKRKQRPEKHFIWGHRVSEIAEMRHRQDIPLNVSPAQKAKRPKGQKAHNFRIMVFQGL